MKLGHVRLLSCGVGVVFCAAAALANDPQEVYQRLFGEEEKTVLASFGRADDVAFARKLLNAAGGVNDSPELQALLHEKAHEFGLKSREGYATAVEALRRQADAFPERKEDCDDKLLKLLDLQFRQASRGEQAHVGRDLLEHVLSMAQAGQADGRFADAVTHFRRASYLAQQLRLPEAEILGERLRAAIAQEQVESQIATYEKVLAANPQNAGAAQRLQMLLVMERDDPNRAEALLPSTGSDEQLRTFLPLLRKEIGELSEQSCLDLGGWYAALAGRATAHGKPKMLLRAQGFYERYLDLHGRSDAPALQAKLQLDRVTRELAKCGGQPRPGGRVAARAGTSLVISDALLAWAKDRDALPLVQQVQALQKKLAEVNNTQQELIASYEEADGRVVSLTFKETADLVSLTPLVGMQLEKLKAIKNNLTDITPLKGMKLQDLDLSWSAVSDVSVLEGMPLTSIQLRECPVAGLPPLKGADLQALILKDCKALASLRGLEGAKVGKLEINQAAIRDLLPLKDTGLTQLTAAGCAGLGSLRGLEGLPLRDLTVHGSAITSLEPLRGLKLTKLNINECKGIRDLSPLQGMPLTELLMRGTQSPNLEALRGMRLRRLDLSRCVQLRDLDVLQTTPLADLEINAMLLTSFECLRGLKLTKLVAKDNPGLMSLAGLDGMPLNSLCISGCPALASLKGLEGLPLTYLDLRGTRFTALSVASDLQKTIPTLKKIDH